ncbi:hypothetical protein [Thermococcus sp.]
MLRVQPSITIMINIKNHEFRFDFPEEEYEPPEKPRVKFLQEVRRIHLA